MSHQVIGNVGTIFAPCASDKIITWSCLPKAAEYMGWVPPLTLLLQDVQKITGRH